MIKTLEHISTKTIDTSRGSVFFSGGKSNYCIRIYELWLFNSASFWACMSIQYEMLLEYLLWTFIFFNIPRKIPLFSFVRLNFAIWNLSWSSNHMSLWIPMACKSFFSWRWSFDLLSSLSKVYSTLWHTLFLMCMKSRFCRSKLC